MTVLSLTPLAWIGLLAVAVPILIHLLTRQQAPVVPFPTLRFLHTTRLSALRRRSIDDWPLLVVRSAILATAAAALASPVFVSRARETEWRTRVVSAFVAVPSAVVDRASQTALITKERAGRFASTRLAPVDRVADGVRDAVWWLGTQPPARREVVIVGDLREGQLSVADLSLVPAAVGIRFLPLPPSRVDRSARHELQRGDSRWQADVTLLDTTTRARYAAVPASTLAITVRAAAEDQAFASAALEAVLARGVNVPPMSGPVVVVFDGGETSNLPLNAGVVRLTRRAVGLEAVHDLERALNDRLAVPRVSEPAPVSPARLASWSRPPGSDPSIPPTDEGDRRWLWALALLLIAIEHLVRRPRHRGADPTSATEKRVA